jgi:uncharacterized protein
VSIESSRPAPPDQLGQHQPGEQQSPTPRGPVRRAERALAPDLARGMMLLFIAVANAVGVVFGGELAGEPHPHGLERWANLALFTTVHARAYPMFAVLFGYGLIQLATRQQASGADPSTVRRIMLRRNALLVAFGAVHAVLLYAGDFLGAYGLVGILATLFLLRSPGWLDRAPLWIWAVCVPYMIVVGAAAVVRLVTSSGPAAALPQTPTESLRASDYLSGLLDRVAEWPTHTLTVLPFIVIVWLGMWAARRRILEDPASHRRLLRRTATGCLAIAFLGGLPLGLVWAGLLHPDAGTLHLITLLQGASGMFGGPGYVALFGLIAGWVTRTVASPRTHPVTGSLAALGQRSLSGYLFQSLAWLLLLAPYTLDLQRHGRPLFIALAVAVVTWLFTVVVAFGLERRRRPGPAEKLLRRLTYGPAGT